MRTGGVSHQSAIPHPAFTAARHSRSHGVSLTWDFLAAEATLLRQLVLLNGCFWGSERVMSQVPDVGVEVGYAGGMPDPDPEPNYYNLSANAYAEAVHVWWQDAPGKLAEILSAACTKSEGDPSSPRHPRYRRAAVCLTAEDAAEVRSTLGAIGRDMPVELGERFYRAESFHQRYYLRTLGPP